MLHAHFIKFRELMIRLVAPPFKVLLQVLIDLGSIFQAKQTIKGCGSEGRGPCSCGGPWRPLEARGGPGRFWSPCRPCNWRLEGCGGPEEKAPAPVEASGGPGWPGGLQPPQTPRGAPELEVSGGLEASPVAVRFCVCWLRW